MGRDDVGGKMEANLKRILDCLLLVENLAALKFVGTSSGEARVQANVLFVIREAPVGDPELKLLRHWGKPIDDQ